MNKKKTISILLSALCCCIVSASPVSWQFKLTDKGNGEVELQCDAQIETGWHLYDTEIGDGGPYPTALFIDELKGATVTGKFKAVGSSLHKEFDRIFDMEVGYYSGRATFVQRFKVTDKTSFVLKGDVRAQACNDKECTPPLPVDFGFTASDLPATLAITDKKQPEPLTGETPHRTANLADAVSPDSTAQAEVVRPTTDADLWAPVIEELKAAGTERSVTGKPLLVIFGVGLLYGLIALITPCVWPMIPMTVSFFLKRNRQNKAKAVREAFTYGLAIIVIYVSLGLLITALFGASALNEMASHYAFNLLFFALLVIFGLSFLGAFELTLPSSWTTKLDRKADSTSGVISIFFMAFTLSLVSFSCTGPLIGTLLVEAAGTGSIIAPASGMTGFALGMAIPFGLFAIFPAALNSLPKSGGWLNSVKVVLGFLELALALKFLSAADLAYHWHILDREVFLSLWIVTFALLGLYLLGKIRFTHDSEVTHLSATRLLLAIAPLSFAVYLVPGLWGAPLKVTGAFVPPLYTQDFNLHKDEVRAKFDDYEAGMEYARKNNKPVFIDFSGYTCTNCRKMEAAVWTDPRVKSMLENDYVLITLMVDDKTKLPETIEVEENGKTSKLKTVGDKWSYLQRHKFGVNSQPCYVTLDYNGKPISPLYAYDEDVEKYIRFLQAGLKNFEAKQ
ncbi:MAG: thioredoxin family protein [Prevotella sp.]|jgi:thiol:disulfide interchange protein DsbD|nr:thioredoxin family protein [Prevotella sp.]